VFVRHLAHPPEDVWGALTEPGQLGAWAPFTTDRALGTPGVAAGWHLCLGVAEHLLDGDPVPRTVGEDAKNHG
jgi:uncharacterized protein YndB with AHSA1/START domain